MPVSELSSVITREFPASASFRVLAAPAVGWLRPEEEGQWDAFVAQHPYGLVYHLSAWKRMLETAFPHIRGKFLVLRDSTTGRIQAGMPVYTVKSWLLGRRISSLPFASFCDPLITSAEQFRSLLPELQALRERTKSRLVEVRSTKTAAYLAEAELHPSSSYKHHYLPLNQDLKDIFHTFAKSSVRQKIHQAERAGVVIEERDGEDSLRICHSILAATRSRRSLPVLPYSFFRAMGQSLRPEHLKVYVACQSGKPVAFHLVLRFRDMWVSEYSGNIDGALNGVNQLLYWDTIQRAHADGAKTFSFGRTSTTNEGLLAYKRRWAPIEEDLVEFNLPRHTWHGELGGRKRPREHTPAYMLTRMFLSKAPSPISRIIGNYFYRHLG